MRCLKIIIVLSVLLPSLSIAQNITVRDRTGKIVNGDTIVCVPGVMQKPPSIDIVCYLYAQNTGINTLEMGVKKTEFILASNVDHSICFGPLCYPSSVFVTPTGETMMSGDIDSTFSGHYRYEGTSHLPAVDLVAYTFYNRIDPADSTIVYVRYNSMSTNVDENIVRVEDELKVFPNPANGVVNFSSGCIGICPVDLVVVNAAGQVVASHRLSDSGKLVSLSTESWVPGVYYYILIKGKEKIDGSFILSR